MGSDPALSTLVTHERHREIPLRDVRDLALAVIEGAVAAEALANELRRAPDRSGHFREIAERLRAVVSRPSIRDALMDDRPNAPVVVVQPAPTRASPAPSAEPVRPQPAEPSSGARALPAVTLSELLDALSRALRVEEQASRLARLDELPKMIGRLEEAASRMPPVDDVTHRLERIEAALGGALRGRGERVLVRTADDALAIASRLVARLRGGNAIAVEIADADGSDAP